MIFFQILSTSSVRKCMQFNMENFNMDSGPYRVNTVARAWKMVGCQEATSVLWG